MLELISIHIPKTAGRTFVTVLKSVYGQHGVAHYERKNYGVSHETAIKKFKNDISDDINVIHGHFCYAEIKNLKVNNDIKLITWFRDPIERVISNYSFFKKRISLNVDDRELQQRREETLLEYASLENSKNRMTKFIEGCNPEDFFFIGIVEQFNSDILKLGEMLNWKPFNIPHINDNSSFKKELPSINEEDRKLIEEWNKQDIELYNKVIKIRNTN